jgi:lipopolysaccharide biosynthesis glycosyltransferase
MRALVFSIDDAFVMPFKVLWHSLVTTNSIPEATPVFVLHENTLSSESIDDCRAFLGNYGWSATFLNASEYLPDDLPISEKDHVSKATFYRLYVGSILPAEVTSLVYLDSDMLVIRSIAYLFEVQLTEPIAAVDHLYPSSEIRLWGACGGTYFQGGVLVIDLDWWRQRDLTSQFHDIIATSGDKIKWWDQDILNLAFRGHWQRLPIWYNFVRYVEAAVDDRAAREHVRLVHFDSSKKPWKVQSSRMFENEWHDAFRTLFGTTLKVKRPKTNRLRSFARRLVGLAFPGGPAGRSC